MAVAPRVGWRRGASGGERMFEIQMLPADEGDCLLLTYGPKTRSHRVLIDGGTPATFKRLKRYLLGKLPAGERHFELLIVTHIDQDHIGGILPLLRSKDLGVTFGDIWFNGWEHLAPRPTDLLGPRQGDLLGNLLSARNTLPWNEAFQGGSVVVPKSRPLPVHVLPGGLKLTLLSPRWSELKALDKSWMEETFKAGRIPGEDPEHPGRRTEMLGELLGRASRLSLLARERFYPDEASANGSSIAVLAEYEGKRALLSGDAFAPVLAEGIRRLPGFKGKLPLDAFKLPHHGSRANLSPELLSLVTCSRYLISTSGKRFKHPDKAAISRILEKGPAEVELCFNYESSTTRGWGARKLPGDVKVRKLKALYPRDAEQGLRVSL